MNAKKARRSDVAAKAAACARTFDLNAEPVDDDGDAEEEEEEEEEADEEKLEEHEMTSLIPAAARPQQHQHQRQQQQLSRIVHPAASDAAAAADDATVVARPALPSPAPACNRVTYCNGSVVVYRGASACIGGDPALAEALRFAWQHVMDPANISTSIGGWWNKDGKRHHPVQFTYGSMGSLDPTDTMYSALHQHEALPPALVRLRDELARVMRREDESSYLAKSDSCTITQYVSGTLIEPHHEPEQFKPILASIQVGGSTGRVVEVGKLNSFMLFSGDAYVVQRHAYENLRRGSTQPFSPPATSKEMLTEFTFYMWKSELKEAARNGLLQWPPRTTKVSQKKRPR